MVKEAGFHPDSAGEDPSVLAMQAYFAGSYLTAMAAVIGAAVVASAYWSPALAWNLGMWLLGISLVAVLRVGSAAAYNRGMFPGCSTATWSRVAFGVPALMGSVWGGGGVYLMGVGDDHQVLVLICLSIGAVMGSISNAVYWPAHVGFFSPLMFFMAVGLIVHPRPESPFLVVGAALITVLMALQGRALGQRLTRALQLTQENEQLIRYLSERTVDLEQANRTLAELSATDALTGLRNRRGWDIESRDRHRQTAVAGEPLGMLVIDIDHFKRYNDTHGHAAGDVCIRMVAGVLKANIRAGSDIAARVGGEEFGVIVPAVDHSTLLQIAERIRVQVEALHPQYPDELHHPITVSIGAALWSPPLPEDLGVFFAVADAELYGAKAGGRNRVCLRALPAGFAE